MIEKTMLLISENKKEMNSKKEGVVLPEIKIMSNKCKLLMDLIRIHKN